jgi:hypothetical protein
MRHPILRQAFKLIAALAVTGGGFACAPRQSSSLMGENTATQFPSSTTYPETIPRWSTVGSQTSKRSDSNTDISLGHSADWATLF